MPRTNRFVEVARWVDLPVLLGFGAFVAYHWTWHARYLIGITLGSIGFALWGLARLQLGKSFSVRAQAKALVTTGLYSKFRNPVYLFGGMAYFGLLLAAWPRCLFFYIPFYILFQGSRIRKEEAVLEKAFGDEYRRYKASTWL